MALGKEIKVTLSLDDSGFSVKTKEAARVVETLKTGLGGLSKSTDQAESSLADLNTNLKGFTEGFGGLQKSLQATVEQLQRAVTGSFDQMSRVAKEGTKVAKDAAQAQIDAKIKTLESELETNRKMLEARGKLHAELRKLESDQRAQSMAAMLEAEKAERGKKKGAQTVIASNLDEADRLERNANAIRSEIAAIERFIATTRQEQVARAENIALLGRERVATIEAANAKATMDKVAAAVGKSNAAEIKRLRESALREQKESDSAAAKSAEDLARLKKQYADREVRDRKEAEAQIRREAAETALAQRRAAQEAAEEARRQSQQVAQMWKGMAQLYAGSKIEQGLMASVKSADDYSRVLERLDAMGLGGAQGKANTLAIAKQVEAANPNMTSTEALKLTLATTAGSVNTDPKVVGQIVPEIAKLTTVMTRMFPEQAHNIEQFTQNMMGVFESRGIANDPEKMRSSLDNLARALVLSQGKMTVQDYETIGRRGGAGNMQFKDDESILYDIAAASQMKTSGGGGGGGAGGVSSYSTMMKQASKGAQGGVAEKRSAMENLVEFGVIDREALLAANGNKPLGRNVKPVPYANAAEASDNMTKFAMDLVNGVKKKLAALPESDTRFFAKGVDRTNDREQAKAFGRWADQSFSNTSRAEFYKMFSTEGAQTRIKNEVSASKAAPDYDEAHKKAMESWGVAVDKAHASMNKLGQAIGTVLIPVLQPLLGLLTSGIDKLTQFAQSSPVATTLTAIAGGFAGVTLGVKGFLSMFGEAGLLGVVKAFLGIAPRVATAIEAPAAISGWSNFTILMENLFAWCGSLITRIPFVGAAVLKLGEAFGIGGGFLKSFGGIFKGLTGVLLAWDFGQLFGTWLGQVKVGTLTIQEHITNMFLDIEVGWKKLMLSSQEVALKFRNFLHIDSDAETDKALAGIKAKSAALAEYERIMRITTSAKKDDAAVDAAKKPAKKLGAGLTNDTSVDPTAETDPTAASSDPKGLYKEHPERKDRDPLNAALENTKGEINAATEKLNAIVVGAETMDSLRKQAADLIEGKRLADEFSPNHDSDRRPGANDPRIVKLKDEAYQKMLVAEQTKAVEFANQRVVATNSEANAAMERLASGGAAKQSDAMRALVRELDRVPERLGAGAASFDKWNKAKNAALFNQSIADGANFAASYHDKNAADSAKLLDTEKARIAAELTAARDAEDKKYQLHVDTIEKTRRAAVASAGESEAEIAAINKRAADAREAMDKEYSERRRIRAEEEARAMESATAKMTREWKDYGKAVDDIGASAANGFVSMITSTLGTGRLEVGKFVQGVLMDIANAKLKQALADPIKGFVDQGANWLKKTVFGGSGIDAASTVAATQAENAKTASVMQGTTAMEMFNQMVNQASNSLASLAASGGGGVGGMSFLGDIGSAFGSGGGADATGAVENFLFADGGIMTSMGPMELRKYANGGIANSPQVAIYGEAGPEAYVPLPDGRTIPVTMTGGQQGSAPNVQVNVINQTSAPVNAQQGGVRFDGKQYILDVVMTAAASPGNFRQTMKDAMK